MLLALSKGGTLRGAQVSDNNTHTDEWSRNNLSQSSEITLPTQLSKLAASVETRLKPHGEYQLTMLLF